MVHSFKIINDIYFWDCFCIKLEGLDKESSFQAILKWFSRYLLIVLRQAFVNYDFLVI